KRAAGRTQGFSLPMALAPDLTSLPVDGEGTTTCRGAGAQATGRACPVRQGEALVPCKIGYSYFYRLELRINPRWASGLTLCATWTLMFSSRLQQAFPEGYLMSASLEVTAWSLGSLPPIGTCSCLVVQASAGRRDTHGRRGVVKSTCHPLEWWNVAWLKAQRVWLRAPLTCCVEL